MSKTAIIREAGESGVNPASPRRVHVRGASIQRSNGVWGRDFLTYGRECGAGSRGFEGERGKLLTAEHERSKVRLGWGGVSAAVSRSGGAEGSGASGAEAKIPLSGRGANCTVNKFDK